MRAWVLSLFAVAFFVALATPSSADPKDGSRGKSLAAPGQLKKPDALGQVKKQQPEIVVQPVPVPEPTTLALFAAGSAGVLALRRRHAA